MRTSKYLILTIVVLIIIVPFARYYTVNPEINACMIDYVDTLKVNSGKGFIYKINGVNHIEPEESILNKYILDYKVGYAHGCLMISGNLFTDFNNSVYCSITYLIKNTPIPDRIPLNH